jgi:hypothetical protein
VCSVGGCETAGGDERTRVQAGKDGFFGDSAVLDLTAGVVYQGIIRAMISDGKSLRTTGGLSQGDGGKKFARLGRYNGLHPWRCVQEWSGLPP